MNKQKIKLSQLEGLLKGVADDLRGKMDAADYKEYIMGMLFLKRMSDVFDQKREEVRRQFEHLPKEAINQLLEDKGTYGDTFFVPKRARWNEGWIDEEGHEVPPIKHLKESIGAYLNKALWAIEDENPETLSGIFKERINFNRQVDGKPVVKNADLEKIIKRFNDFPALINENFEFPDLLGTAYEYILKFFADEAGKKGGQFYTPGQVVRLLVQLLELKEGMKICDPTVGSGGMLIQCHQWLEEQGKNADNIELFGQENDPAVVALSRMNLILHNITKYRIEYCDTIAEPALVSNGQLIKFDRLIANPPFSQNYNRAEMRHPERFTYGFLPESGKKADLMFVQHMLSVCTSGGKVVVIMPHGVLFRGGKEKDIRRLMLTGKNADGTEAGVKHDVLEGVIGLPPQLFYGTGIPACVMVFNKQKPDALKDKVFFINADLEYKEGKKQNTLRPEDIEKITTTFLSKTEIPRYSRLVPMSEIADERNDFSLNIRRYVDNTPAPEAQDVKAHLVGGVPDSEIADIATRHAHKFSFIPKEIFKKRNANYSDFCITDKNEIKDIVEHDDSVLCTGSRMNKALEDWWQQGSEVFASLAGNQQANLPAVRARLLGDIDHRLTPLGVLDHFQVSGIFVRWWDGIKYDLKTIRQRGWDIDLVNNDDFCYLIINKYFQAEQQRIDELQAQIARLESDLSVLVEEALELCEYEPEESEDGKETKITPKLAKEQIAIATEEIGETEAQPYNDKLKEITDKEAEIKQTKSDLQAAEEMLDTCVRLKCYGIDEEIAPITEKQEIAQKQLDELNLDLSLRIASIADRLDDITGLEQINKSVASLERRTKAAQKKLPTIEGKQLLSTIAVVKRSLKEVKKQDKGLRDTLEAIDSRIDQERQLFKQMGGQVTDEECRELILQKHFSLVSTEMNHYLDTEKRALIAAYEHLFEKYAVSARQIAEERDAAMKSLNDALAALHYLD